jgi:hypothetical protein
MKILKLKSNMIDSTQTCLVSIPYIDKSLVKQLGYEKIGNRNLVYFVEMPQMKKETAVKCALAVFWDDTLLQPIINNAKIDKHSLLKIVEDNITVKNIKQRTY